MTTVTVQGIPIYVSERGAGPPVVLLHGNPDSSGVWDGVVSHLSANFRCITPQLEKPAEVAALLATHFASPAPNSARAT